MQSASTESVIRLLGPCEVTGPQGPAGLSGTRQRALLALLALEAGTVVSQSHLIDSLWGEQPPRTALRTLQSHVARVRQALDACGLPEVLVTRGPGYLLDVDRQTVDAHLFEQLVRRARTEGAGDLAQRLEQALHLWRGDALAGLDEHDWAAAARERLHAMRLAAWEDMCEARLRLGELSVVADLERLAAAHPTRERLVGLLMLALYRSGRQAEALERYQRLRARLGEELGLDPGTELRELHRAVLRRDPALEPARPAAAVPAQLPAPVGHFAGRNDELAMLRGWQPDTYLAVVSGPAGVGKTALAVQWAHAARSRFPDGQLFLDLRGHDPDTALTPADALAHVLRGLGVAAERVPAEVPEQSALLRSLLGGRRVLIVLDNAGTADHVLPLVPAAPGSALLVTSRGQLSALAVRHAVHGVPLDVFAPDDAVGLLARVLGADRVRVQADAAAELARLCGGLPLALRIAAAKLAARPRQRIADLVEELSGEDRLDALTLPGDSQGIRGVLDTAYRALSEPAARLLRLLGLHPGLSFTAHLAAALAGMSYGRVRRSVDELAAAHLIIEVDSGRYRFHDLIRLYAHERALADEPEPARVQASDRLLDWYGAISAATNTALSPTRTRLVPEIAHQPEVLPFRPESAAAVGFLDTERDNLVPVVAFAVDAGRYRQVCELTYLLAGFYGRRGSGADRIAICELGVLAATRLGDVTYEGLMRSALGVAYIGSHRYDEALAALAEALPLTRTSGERRDEGHVHNNIAVAYGGLRRFDEAAASFERALELLSRNDPAAVAMALNNLGYAEARAGRADPATLERALELARQVGNVPLEAAVLHGLGLTHRNGDDHERALAALRESIGVFRRIGDLRQVPDCLTDLGATLLATGDHAGAVAHFTEAVRLSRSQGDHHVESIALGRLGHAYLAAGDPAAAREHLDRALSLRRSLPDPYELERLHELVALVEHETSG